MLIDFHTHCFPDNLAARAIGTLSATSRIACATDGTASDTIRLMKETNPQIDLSISCHIATNPKQQQNVNNFAIKLHNDYNEFISFGSIHPDYDRGAVKGELVRLKEAGIPGIKVHPDYMHAYITDKRLMYIFNLCAELDMPVITHAGYDPYSPDLAHTTPEGLLEVITEIPSLTLVAAHFGGNRMWDDVEKLLAGKNIWFDVSMTVLEGLKPEQAKRIIDIHSPDKILFGSDTPWCLPELEIEYIKKLGLSKEQNDKIFYKNALALLDGRTPKVKQYISSNV